MSKVDARRVQMLVRQREALEKELDILQRDVEELVRNHAKTSTVSIYAYWYIVCLNYRNSHRCEDEPDKIMTTWSVLLR